jgi:hypothetical protein
MALIFMSSLVLQWQVLKGLVLLASFHVNALPLRFVRFCSADPFLLTLIQGFWQRLGL